MVLYGGYGAVKLAGFVMLKNESTINHFKVFPTFNDNLHFSSKNTNTSVGQKVKTKKYCKLLVDVCTSLNQYLIEAPFGLITAFSLLG